jgi:hypothetical protein
MDYRCFKIRVGHGSPTNDHNGVSVMKTYFDVFLEPVHSQADTSGGLAQIRLGLWNDCEFKQGEVYSIDLSAKPVTFTMVRNA